MPVSKPRYYPASLAAELLARWPAPARASLPAATVLEEFISVAYQASLLTEEGQPVRCRLLLQVAVAANPAGTEGALYVLELATQRPYEEQELRRLSPALCAGGSLLAVRPEADDNLLIWAVLRGPEPALAEDVPHLNLPGPPALLLYVRGPGNLVFYCGRQQVLTLQYGRVEGHGFVDYPVAWSYDRFTENVAALGALLGEQHAASLPSLLMLSGEMGHHVVRRVVARVRASGHGGMLAFVPTTGLGHYVGTEATLRPKYPVQPPAAPSPYLALQAAIITRLLELGELSWEAFRGHDDAGLRGLAADLDQFADLLADLMTVDGAVVVTKQMTIVGFGIEVYAPQLHLPVVYRARNAAATDLQPEPADSGGTRHRAAYRLCRAEPESMAVVISQDGGVRFVHAQAEKVIFWEQLTV